MRPVGAAAGSAFVAVNTRTLAQATTGVQRYAREVLARLPGPVAELRPTHPALVAGPAGHLWEQVVLAARLGRRVLWSPANTGPLLVDRQVLTIHDLAPLEHPEWFQPAFAAWYRWLLPRLVRRVRRLLAVSDFTRRRLVDLLHVDPQRVSVAYPGVNPRFRPQPDDAIQNARRRLALPDGRYVLTLGSLEPRKNLGTLLEAWRRAVHQLPSDLHLVVAGEPGSARVFAAGDGTLAQTDLRALRVVLTGRVPEEFLPALVSGAELFVFPSLYEGFGLPPLEAMACGVPAIVGDGSALPEVVGEAALRVDPRESDELARRLVEVVREEELRRRLGRLGRERAARFTWEAAATATWNALEEVWRETADHAPDGPSPVARPDSHHGCEQQLGKDG